MYVFEIKQKERLKILSAFHLLLALIFVLDLSHVTREGKKDWFFSGVYLAGSVALFIAGIFQRQLMKKLSRHLILLLVESALILGGAIYFWSKGASLVAFSHGLLAGAIILFWLYLKKKEHGEKIVVAAGHIMLPGLSGERMVEWRELSNLVKKFDLLTIDFKNNKLLQVQLIDDENIDEIEFNAFCKQQLLIKNK